MAMPKPLTIKIIGLDETEQTLSRINFQARRRVKDVIQETGDAVVGRAQDKVPQRTGELHDSIHFEQSGLSGRVLVEEFYGHFVEFGTENMAAQPFLHPAWEEEKPQYTQRVRDAIQGLARDI